ncbi:pyrophosphatase [Caulobacter mirabilis]|uniref:Pyrophosphatase n=1 Tax=Caulobacter mirabilis TaxID=69666 RepID=A0A2D2B093_9CAUL|nr:pyrophosphatase [Caulobacter mirabilis]ATQ43675.1 pyrophosphatase [Caulobacter mirabilis]
MTTVEAFQAAVVRTDRRKKDKTRIAVMGVFGELGSLMAEFKKRSRDGTSYRSFHEHLVEEAGDLLWYLTILAVDLGVQWTDILSEVYGKPVGAQTRLSELDKLPLPAHGVEANLWLRAAGKAGLLAETAERSGSSLRPMLVETTSAALVAMRDAKISLSRAATSNIAKSESRFPQTEVHLPLYDDRPHPDGRIRPDERLPKYMVFHFEEIQIGKKTLVVQKVHTIKIGDPLTDNIAEPDHYRFHDVFHLAYAAILGWSPVLRALLKAKRKSVGTLDENEDGARAILLEEGISTYIFNWAKPDYFKGVKKIDYTLLKTIKHFVRGYEVEDQPFWAWEKAILRGYSVFRELVEHRRGLVTIDLTKRDLFYELIPPSPS